MIPERPKGVYLAVPAHRASMVSKAAASEADAVFLDLEDAVPPAEKAAALAGAIAAIGTLDWGRKWLSVRVNGIDSGSQQGEISALAGMGRLNGIILPKAERADDVRSVASLLTAARGGRWTRVALELLVETARGVVEAESLAAADPLVCALHLGVGDFAASIGARTVDIGVSPPSYELRGAALDLFAYPMMRVLVAARAFGLAAIDGPYGAFRDDLATTASAARAAAMGFDGKQVIHPGQIGPTRSAFRPTDAELDYARRVQAAYEEAAKQGLGAISVDGKMIDEANLRLIRRLLDFAG